MSRKIIIASDHGGITLKKAVVEHLFQRGFDVVDLGPSSTESCDYPVYAGKLCKQVLDENVPGILICGTGLGMSMSANRFAGIRAAVCHNEFSARMAKAHNNANVICLGERVLGTGMAFGIVDAWIDAEFEGDRHQRRIDLIETLQA